MNQQIDNYLDTTGLMCPEPVMMMHQAVRAMEAGQVMCVTATDPSTTRDIPKFCLFLGHELVESSESDGVYRYLVRLGK